MEGRIEGKFLPAMRDGAISGVSLILNLFIACR